MSDVAQTTETPVITLTAAAAEEVANMSKGDPANAGKPLRVYVEQGGCSGMQYGMTFDEVRDGDKAYEFHGVQVVIDSFSAEYLSGTVVDFNEDLSDHGFKISNPNAKTSCGCGKSFEA